MCSYSEQYSDVCRLDDIYGSCHGPCSDSMPGLARYIYCPSSMTCGKTQLKISYTTTVEVAFDSVGDLCVYELSMDEALLHRNLGESLIDKINYVPEITLRVVSL